VTAPALKAQEVYIPSLIEDIRKLHHSVRLQGHPHWDRWFQRYDTTQHGRLHFGQVIRGVLQTMEALGVVVEDRITITTTLSRVWSGAGLDQSVSEAEFLKPDGLAKMICTQFLPATNSSSRSHEVARYGYRTTAQAVRFPAPGDFAAYVRVD